MEFPTLGANCAFQGCHVLDFLPFPCSHCSAIFCSSHRLTDAHACPSAPAPVLGSGRASPLATQPCAVDACARLELASFACTLCDANFCLRHRLAEDHGCPGLAAVAPPPPPVAAGPPAEAPPDTSLQRLRAAVAKSSGIATKVLLMKLKMSAEGEASVAPVERQFLVLTLPHGSQHKGKTEAPVFVCKVWTVGRCIDSVSKLLGVSNQNGVFGAKKLRMWSSDGTPLVFDHTIEKEVQEQCEHFLLEYDVE